MPMTDDVRDRCLAFLLAATLRNWPRPYLSTANEEAVKNYIGATDVGLLVGEVFAGAAPPAKDVGLRSPETAKDKTYAFFSSGTPQPYYDQCKEMMAAGRWTVLAYGNGLASNCPMRFREALCVALDKQPEADKEDVFTALYRAFAAKKPYVFDVADGAGGLDRYEILPPEATK